MMLECTGMDERGHLTMFFSTREGKELLAEKEQAAEHQLRSHLRATRAVSTPLRFSGP